MPAALTLRWKRLDIHRASPSACGQWVRWRNARLCLHGGCVDETLHMRLVRTGGVGATSTSQTSTGRCICISARLGKHPHAYLLSPSSSLEISRGVCTPGSPGGSTQIETQQGLAGLCFFSMMQGGRLRRDGLKGQDNRRRLSD